MTCSTAPRPRAPLPGARARSVAALAILLGLASCEGIGAPPPASCSAIGARCQLAGGPVGVCQETRCTGDAGPPCFVCTPQH